MHVDLQDKVAVVTGASRGIGLAVVRQLVEEGARVVAGARSGGALAELDDDRVEVVAVDLTTPDGPSELVARALERFGRVDVLVNNVGGADARMGGFLSVTDEMWLDSYELNVMTAVRASRAALPAMVELGAGAIVNVSSVNAHLPQPPVADYAAAKAAMNNLTKQLSEEFGPQGVRVNSVSPGPVRTSLWEGEGRFGQQMAQAMGAELTTLLDQGLPQAAGLTLGRMIDPDEVATLVLLLASPRAATVTGSDFVIDSGMIKSL